MVPSELAPETLQSLKKWEFPYGPASWPEGVPIPDHSHWTPDIFEIRPEASEPPLRSITYKARGYTTQLSAGCITEGLTGAVMRLDQPGAPAGWVQASRAGRVAQLTGDALTLDLGPPASTGEILGYGDLVAGHRGTINIVASSRADASQLPNYTLWGECASVSVDLEAEALLHLSGAFSAVDVAVSSPPGSGPGLVRWKLDPETSLESDARLSTDGAAWVQVPSSLPVELHLSEGWQILCAGVDHALCGHTGAATLALGTPGARIDLQASRGVLLLTQWPWPGDCFPLDMLVMRLSQHAALLRDTPFPEDCLDPLDGDCWRQFKRDARLARTQ
jgi:hypothetical protein